MMIVFAMVLVTILGVLGMAACVAAYRLSCENEKLLLLCRQMADRIEKQAELLSKQAERRE